MLSLLTLAAAGLTAAQSQNLLPMNPGGAIPAGVAQLNTSGFQNAVVLPARGGYAICASGDFPVTVSTPMGMKINMPMPANQSEVTNTIVQMSSSGASMMMGSKASINGTFVIGGTLCMPDAAAPGAANLSRVDVLTHGVGFDRFYWDWAPGYSYADYAALQNVATFFYDRLGVGSSDKPDALNVVQAPLEVEIANTIATMLRQGKFGGKAFSKVVGVGHSFGSFITQAVTAQYPATLDAAVLTGFSTNSSGMPGFSLGLNAEIASANAPYRFAGLSNGYLVAVSAISTQIAFFRAPTFDPKQLVQADAQKGTVTLGELLTLSSVSAPAKSWSKPLVIANGAEDLPLCSGNCSYPTNLLQAVQPALYPALNGTGNFATYQAPGTGHGVNLHYTAVEAYKFIDDFLKSKGL